LVLVDGKFVATIRVSNSTPALLQKMYKNWLKERAHEIFEDKVKDIQKNSEYCQIK